jgi:branched-chain amino acid transport system substrate-binding protein
VLTGPFTGGSAPLGVSNWQVAQLNHNGGIGGKKIELVERDDESKPGVQLAQELINSERIVAAVGIANTPVALAASRFYQESKVPIIIPVAMGSVVSKQFQPQATSSA